MGQSNVITPFQMMKVTFKIPDDLGRVTLIVNDLHGKDSRGRDNLLNTRQVFIIEQGNWPSPKDV